VSYEELKQSIASALPELSRELLETFFARMEEEYFLTFSAPEIATHLRLASALSADAPIQVRIVSQNNGEFEIVIVGFDYLGQFSMFCGLMSAFALDIRAGDVFSFAKRSRSSKVVDVFKVAPIAGETFDQGQQLEFTSELQVLTRLLAEGSIQEARTRLYRFLTERIEKLNQPLGGLLSPLMLEFDNQTRLDRTIMEVRSQDTFAFLYAASNALSLRGVYISAVRIRGADNRTHDRFIICDHTGRKIREGTEQERLTLAVQMIVQFTRFVTEAPDPAKAMHHFDQFLDKLVELGNEALYDRTLSLLSRSEGMSRLARLLGSSDDLWDNFLRIHFNEMVPLIEDDTMPAGRATMQRELESALDAASADAQKGVLNAFKDRQLFLIEVRHLLQVDRTPSEFSEALTDLAEAVMEEAARISHARVAGKFDHPAHHDANCPFAMFALGKFGGREMGYASDLELLFVHDGHSEFFETLAHQIVALIEARSHGVFRIDLRLRPHGDAGSWSTSYEQFEKYYSVGGDAAPFERQALIKLRWFAGDSKLGLRVEAHRNRFTYGSQPWDWKDALLLRERQMRELVKPGKTNVKYSAGGIVDIEYAVQYLQLLNGAEHPEIRLPSTLESLERLRQLQIVGEKDYHLLRSAYLFLRQLIDALRIVRGDASDLLLPESADEFKSLARRMGYRETDRAAGAERLAADIRETMEKVHGYFVARFHPA
jgi:[glutamine synthetase] adenylyltransferase / [glutamine synthetase]-adenylyl-L-tyrosine phosphorylase